MTVEAFGRFGGRIKIWLQQWQRFGIAACGHVIIYVGEVIFADVGGYIGIFPREIPDRVGVSLDLSGAQCRIVAEHASVADIFICAVIAVGASLAVVVLLEFVDEQQKSFVALHRAAV